MKSFAIIATTIKCVITLKLAVCFSMKILVLADSSIAIATSANFSIHSVDESNDVIEETLDEDQFECFTFLDQAEVDYHVRVLNYFTEMDVTCNYHGELSIFNFR